MCRGVCRRDQVLRPCGLGEREMGRDLLVRSAGTCLVD